LIPLFLFVLALSQKQLADRPIIIDAAGSRYASDYILVATSAGIYTFDRTAKTWKSITTAHGLPDNMARVVGIDQGIMWVATDSGLGSADIRLNDWRTYTLDGQITGISFDDSYVWVTGDFGLKRFDKYVETWQHISDATANDILYDGTYMWLATPQGIQRYNIEFERLEKTQTAPVHDYYYIIETGSRIWFLARDSFVAYEKNAESWAEYPALEITDFAILGDSLFVVSGRSVFLYNPTTDSWGSFVEIEGFDDVNGLSLNPKVSNNLSLATDHGLLMYDLTEKTRKVYNRINGLLHDSLTDVYETTGFIFAVARDHIQYYDAGTGIWQLEEIAPVTAARGEILYYDEAGLHAGIADDFDLRLEGRAYYSLSSTVTDSFAWSDYSTVNLRLIGQHASNRMVSIYYDNSNKEDTLYGFGYRGLDSDFLYRANGGFVESEYYEFNLVPTYSTFGANARLRHDDHSLMLQGGQLKSIFRSDFFYGRSFEQENTLLDIQYSKNSFYRIPVPWAIDPAPADTIFIDDRIPETNGIDTRTDYTLAGIHGDFDPLIKNLDYFIDHEHGLLQLLNSVSDSTVIIFKSNGQEVIVQSDSLRNNMLTNIYFLGPNIIPGSLELQITDTLGTIHPLSDFGVDNDGDGHIDPEYLNHKLGYLIFPQSRPFPDEVYENNINIYVMQYRFSTESVFYRLSEQPVLVNSEKIYVDGEAMLRDFHYIIDYTSGTVLFLSEEAVNDFSEVEVQYVALARERDDIFYSVQPNIQIGDNINLAPGYTKIEEEDLVHLSGKYQAGTDDRSLMFVPQLAVNQDRETAQDYRLIANYRSFTVNANYRGYEEGFQSFGLSDRRYGELRHSGTISLGLEPLNYVRLSTTLKRETLNDSMHTESTPQYITGRIDYLNPNTPNGFLLIARNKLPDHDKSRMQLNTNYSVQVAGNGLRFASVARQDVLTFTGEEQKVNEYVLNTNIALRIPVRTDLYLHGVNTYSNGIRQKEESEVRLGLNIDALPGLYYTGNYRQKKYTYHLAGSSDLSIYHYLYNNLNVAPGRWYAPLSIINFSFGNGRNFDEYLDDISNGRELPSFILNPLEDDIATITDLRTVYAKVYLTPISNLSIQLKRTVNRSGSGRFGLPILRPNYADEIRAEYELASIGFLSAIYDRTENRAYPILTTRNLYLEWTKPWTSTLRTKLSGNLRSNTNDYATALTVDSEANMRMETLLRFGKKSYVNFSLAGRHQDRYLTGVANAILPGCGINLNLLEFIFLQLDYEADIIINASTTHILSARITGSF
jgi:hypothetical protein